ncbi:hypothetical protein F5887DRAFT_454884 [Amanita rubescens]|nr:hypothetical protein F5887DRAFT_454884 [Amanita rubescens]
MMIYNNRRQTAKSKCRRGVEPALGKEFILKPALKIENRSSTIYTLFGRFSDGNVHSIHRQYHIACFFLDLHFTAPTSAFSCTSKGEQVSRVPSLQHPFVTPSLDDWAVSKPNLGTPYSVEVNTLISQQLWVGRGTAGREVIGVSGSGPLQLVP